MGGIKDSAAVNSISCIQIHLQKQGLLYHQQELTHLLPEVSYRNRADRSLSYKRENDCLATLLFFPPAIYHEHLF